MQTDNFTLNRSLCEEITDKPAREKSNTYRVGTKDMGSLINEEEEPSLRSNTVSLIIEEEEIVLANTKAEVLKSLLYDFFITD
jgi:hypothetical protein